MIPILALLLLSGAEVPKVISKDHAHDGRWCYRAVGKGRGLKIVRRLGCKAWRKGGKKR